MSTTSELLKQFYQLEEDNKSSDPTNIDGKSFEPEPFFVSLVASNNLSVLSKKHSIIQEEINHLDKDLQEMVYDNYTKFLQAEDTIQQMSKGLSDIPMKVESLKRSLATVSEQSSMIRADLTPNRDKIQRMVGINRLLERIDFISQLPIKLRAHIEIGEYENAVEMWMKAEKVLETQTHYESFVRIRDECRSILEDVKIKVRAQMLSENSGPRVSIKSAILLIKLQSEPNSVLKELWRSRTSIEIKKIDDSSKLPADLFRLLEYLRSAVIETSVSFITEYQKSMKQNRISYKKGNFQDDMDEYILSFKKEIFTKIAKAFKMESIFALSCECFGSFVVEFISCTTTIGIIQQKDSYIQTIVQKFIQSKFSGIIHSIIEQITKSESGPAIENSFKDILDGFKRDMSCLISDFDHLVRAYPDSKDHIIQETTKFFSKALNSIESVDSRYSMIAFGLCHHMSERSIPQVFEMVSRFDHDSPLLNMQDVLCKEASLSASKCLKRFVDIKRKMLSEILSQGMTSTTWIEARTPHDVSISSCLVLQEINLIWLQLLSIISKVRGGSNASSQSSRSSRNRFSGFSGSSVSSNNMPLFHGLREDSIHQIDRLFTTVNHLHLEKAPDIQAKSIISSISLYALKTMLEFVRNDLFSCAGFNQMQVDGYFFYMTLHDKVENTSLFNALIEEILSSAADRAVNPIPFKMVVLSEIYQRSKSKPNNKENL